MATSITRRIRRAAARYENGAQSYEAATSEIWAFINTLPRKSRRHKYAINVAADAFNAAKRSRNYGVLT